jgi:hypothetical protein
MITPSYGLTATERVLPRLALDWTTGVAQPGVDVTRAGVATFVGSNGLIQSATADTQRVDWATGVAGLLVEEQRNNILQRSEALNISPWSGDNSGGTNPIVTANQAIAPDGTLTADRVQLNRGTGTFSRLQQIIVAASAVYTFSVYLKLHSGATPANVGIRVDTTGVNCVVTNAWQRFSVTTSSATITPVPQILLFSTLGSDATADIVAWGAQTEAGTFPTSYIPTEATAVTRNADVATMTGTNFSDWFNPTEGTFVFEFTTDGAANRYYYQISTAVETNSMYGYTGGTFTRPVYVLIGGSLTVSLISATVASNTPIRLSASYKENDFGSAENGTALRTDTSSAVPAVDRLSIGSRFNGLQQINGHMRQFFYYPQRITNAELLAFSKQG